MDGSEQEDQDIKVSSDVIVLVFTNIITAQSRRIRISR